jgi:cell division protein ZapA (FtsZ GTPase activity inhibitor)
MSETKELDLLTTRLIQDDFQPDLEKHQKLAAAELAELKAEQASLKLEILARVETLNVLLEDKAQLRSELAELKRRFAWEEHLRENAETSYSAVYNMNLDQAEQIAQLRSDLEEARKVIENAWIPIRERMPEPDKSFPWGSVSVELYVGDEIRSPAWYHYNDKQWKSYGEDIDSAFVSHWRLPQPPKDGEK